MNVLAKCLYKMLPYIYKKNTELYKFRDQRVHDRLPAYTLNMPVIIWWKTLRKYIDEYPLTKTHNSHKHKKYTFTKKKKNQKKILN